MSLIEVNWNPDRRQLRTFGVIALVASTAIALLLYWLKGVSLSWTFVVFTIGLVICLSSIFCISLTRAIYVGMMAVTLPIGYVASFSFLAAFYFLVLTPIGIIFALIRRDSLRRRFDKNAVSYWIPHKPPENPERYFQQF